MLLLQSGVLQKPLPAAIMKCKRGYQCDMLGFLFSTMAVHSICNNMLYSFVIIQFLLVLRVHATQIRGAATSSKYCLLSFMHLVQLRRTVYSRLLKYGLKMSPSRRPVILQAVMPRFTSNYMDFLKVILIWNLMSGNCEILHLINMEGRRKPPF